MAGYGSDFTWGTVSQTPPLPSSTQYMSYTDNPVAPHPALLVQPDAHGRLPAQLQHVLERLQLLYVMQPGDSYEAPIYTGKQAFLAAINTMQNNHPNDWFTLVSYSWPRDSCEHHRSLQLRGLPAGDELQLRHGRPLLPVLHHQRRRLANNTEITPYDADPATGTIPSANFVDTPRPKGNTCFAMALMLCYNQFAVTPTTDTTLRTFVTISPITFPTGMAGGMGRKGAQKVIIFETDGLANTSATASLVTVRQLQVLQDSL